MHPWFGTLRICRLSPWSRHLVWCRRVRKLERLSESFFLAGGSGKWSDSSSRGSSHSPPGILPPRGTRLRFPSFRLASSLERGSVSFKRRARRQSWWPSSCRMPYLPNIKLMCSDVVEFWFVLLLDRILQRTNRSTALDLDRKSVVNVGSKNRTVERYNASHEVSVSASEANEQLWLVSWQSGHVTRWCCTAHTPRYSRQLRLPRPSLTASCSTKRPGSDSP